MHCPTLSYPAVLLGASDFLTRNHFKKQFFSVYQSPKDFALRAVSIGTAPILITAEAIRGALLTGFRILEAFTTLFKSSLEQSKQRFKDSAYCAFGTSIVLGLAILSPLINFIDLIGSATNTLRQKLKTEPSLAKDNLETTSLASCRRW